MVVVCGMLNFLHFEGSFDGYFGPIAGNELVVGLACEPD